LGAKSVLAFAQHNPAHIYVSGRNETAAEAVIKQAKDAGTKSTLTFLKCDLADLSSVKTAADKVIAEQDRLDLFMANGGIMATPPGLTKDGYELQFGTNHLGHALLIRKLLPLLQSTATQGLDTRIIILTSLGWQMAPKGGIQFKQVKTTQDAFFGSWLRYGQSKLANLIYAQELARRYPDITTVSVHPGVIMTDLVGGLPLSKRIFVSATSIGMKRKPEEGAWSQLWCVGTPKEELHKHNGAFYEPVGVLSDKSNSYSKDPALATELWDFTEKEVAPFMG
jgi:NAD(P)-dependent dehydrogenase (short-subunit alcohol dehydrogenase family)